MQYLYKYYSPESYSYVFNEHGISMRLSQPSVLNDIFELQGANYFSNDDEFFDIIKLIDKLKGTKNYETLKHESDLAKSFCRVKILEDIKKNSILNSDKNFGITSLTVNKNSRTMWSYYANSHKGFMIEFTLNSEEEYLTFKNRCSLVTYSSERPRSFYQQILKNGKEGLDQVDIDLFSKIAMTKDIDWEKEQEFRVIGLLSQVPMKGFDDEGFPVHCYNIPPKAINAIYAGARSSEQLRRKIRNWIRLYAPSIKFFIAEPCDIKYEMIYTKDI